MPPNNLNLFVQPDELGTVLGTDLYSSEYPSYIECPINKGHKLIIYQHPTEGHWFFCPKCGFSGDAIELVQVVKNLPNIDAVRYLSNKNVFTISKSEVEHRYQAYNDYYISYRRIVNALWRKCQVDFYENPTSQWRQIMADRGWRVDDEKTWRATLGKYIGGGHRKDIENCLTGRTGRLFRADRWSHVVVLPWYELPGKICGFTFLNKENAFRWDLEGARSKRRSESGLFMMGDCLPGADTIYAFKNYSDAIDLQLRVIPNTFNLLNIVVWDYATEIAWRNIKAKKIVFWSPELEGDLFQQAAKVDNAYIYPIGSKELKQRMNTYTVAAVVDAFDKKSSPADEVFTDWVGKLDNKKAYQIMTTYKLPDYYVPSLQAPNSITDIEDESFSADNQITLNGCIIQESEGKWYALGRRGEKEMICDAPIHFEYITVYENQKDATFSGTVAYNAEKIPFVASAMDDISEPAKTASWLQRFLSIEAAKGFPDIHPKWGRYLFTIAQRMSNPICVKGSARVGWSPQAETYVLPHFSIKGGAKADCLFEQSAGGPLKGLRKMPKLPFESMIKNGDFVNYATLAIPFLYNCSAMMLGKRPIKMAIRCKSNPNKLSKALKETIGTDEYLIDRRKSAADKLETVAALHDIPTLLSCASNGYRLFIKWSNSVKECNVMGIYDEQLIRAATIHTDWAVSTVDCHDPGWVIEMLIESVPWYVANSQIERELRANPMEMAQANFMKYIQRSVKLDDGLVRAIQSNLTYGSVEGEVPAEDRFVNFVIHLLRSKAITMKHEGASRERTCVSISDKRGKAHINKSSFNRYLRDLGIGEILIPCSNNLVDHGHLVSMDLNYWENMSKSYIQNEQQ